MPEPGQTHRVFRLFVPGMALIIVLVAAFSLSPARMLGDFTSTVSPTVTGTASPTPPYDPTLYALRRYQFLYIAASYGPTEDAVFQATEAAVIATWQGTTTPLPTPTWGNSTAGLSGVNAAGTLAALMFPTPAPALPTAQYTECGWQWATQPLPELTGQIRAMFIAAGIADIEIQATAFGENCVPGREGIAGYFAAMETDFDLTLTMDAGLDDEAIGRQVANALDVLALFPPDNTPGPMSGYLRLVILQGSTARQWRLNVNDALAAREQGLTGAALLAALDAGD
ncbi:MAG: hypothetical protein H6671_17020 [Anaerolineaceae bacterium]|nr:hypothetical protein [Anaerolineaceae bacterium]